ncbi:MAG: AAA family ATPase [bacterium]|jgi:uncharacterized protein YhaN
MRFSRFTVENFGCIQEWRSPKLGTDPVVFYGPNEAGKSTLFHLLSTLLYGYHPANREQFPYTPRDGGMPAGHASIYLADGTKVDIYRRLRSQPEGQLVKDNVTEELRNRTVPFAAHVPRQLFQELFALTLDKLCFPQEQLWSDLQDYLLGGLATSFLRPVSKVVADLEREADKLWRADRRGRPKDRELRQKLLQLHGERQAAREREERIRSLLKEHALLKAEVIEMQATRVNLATFLRRAKRLAPVQKKNRRIEMLRQEGGDLTPYANIPAEPLAYIDAIKAELVQLNHRIGQVRQEKQLKEAIWQSFATGNGKIKDKIEQIKPWLKRASYLAVREETLRQLEGDIKQLEVNLSQAAKELFVQPWSKKWETAFKAISPGELRLRLGRWRELYNLYQDARARTRSIEGQCAPAVRVRVSPLALILFIAGMLLFTVGCLQGIDLLRWGGSGLLLVGGAEIWSWYRRRQELANLQQGINAELHTVRKDENRLEEQSREAQKNICKLFGDLPIAPAWLENPTEELLGEVRSIQAMLQDLQQRQEQQRVLKEQLAEEERELIALAEQCGVLLEGDNRIQKLLTRLEAKLVAVEEEALVAQAAVSRLKELNEEESMLEKRMTSLAQEQAQVIALLAELGAGDWQRGAAVLIKRRQAKADAEALQRSLEQEETDLPALLDEIKAAAAAGEEWTFSDQEIVAAEAKIETLGTEIAAIQEKLVAIEKDLEYDREQNTLDYIEGEIEALEEQRRELWVRRDQLALLRNFLVEADRRFREQHQPDVLRRGGEYLKKISGGRYDRLFLVEEEGRQVLYLRQAGRLYPVPVNEALSRGTLDQVYLALRLALVDHIDGDRERLPLYLDEVLVNWDQERRERGLELIANICQQRQVFLFTCHPWLVVEMEDKLHAQVIDLYCTNSP